MSRLTLSSSSSLTVRSRRSIRHWSYVLYQSINIRLVLMLIKWYMMLSVSLWSPWLMPITNVNSFWAWCQNMKRYHRCGLYLVFFHRLIPRTTNVNSDSSFCESRTFLFMVFPSCALLTIILIQMIIWSWSWSQWFRFEFLVRLHWSAFKFVFATKKSDLGGH